MSDDTITVRVIEIHEKHIKVPADLPYVRRKEKAYLQCIGGNPKTDTMTKRYVEDLKPISYDIAFRSHEEAANRDIACGKQ